MADLPALTAEELERRACTYLARADKAETENIRLRSENAVANENIIGYRAEIKRLREGIQGVAQGYCSCSRCGWGDERKRDMWEVWAHVDPDNERRTIPCDAAALWELLEPAALTASDGGSDV